MRQRALAAGACELNGRQLSATALDAHIRRQEAAQQTAAKQIQIAAHVVEFQRQAEKAGVSFDPQPDSVHQKHCGQAARNQETGVECAQ